MNSKVYKLLLKNIQFYGYHGVFPEERTLGQQFSVDIEIIFERKEIEDNLNTTINYAKLYDMVISIGTGKKFELIETLADEIADLIFEKFPAISLKVKIKKPYPPLPGIIDSAEIEVERKK